MVEYPVKELFFGHGLLQISIYKGGRGVVQAYSNHNNVLDPQKLNQKEVLADMKRKFSAYSTALHRCITGATVRRCGVVKGTLFWPPISSSDTTLLRRNMKILSIFACSFQKKLRNHRYAKQNSLKNLKPLCSYCFIALPDQRV